MTSLMWPNALCAFRTTFVEPITFRVVYVCVVLKKGEIQQLLIIDDPRAAETYCQDYIPDCDAALPYDNILTETEEVSYHF